MRNSPSPDQIVAAIVAIADDGFCKRGELVQRFPKVGARDLRQALRRAVAAGLVIERRGPDGGFHLALSSEGWNLHRSG
jgi:DNA-binding IscR family transcriptional regulator